MSVAKQLAELTDRFAGPSRRERLRALLSGSGREHPDPTPHSLATDFERPPTIQELVQQYIRAEVSAQADQEGQDTFEDHDDFEPEDPEELPFTPYVLTEAQLIEEHPTQDASPPEDLSAPAQGAPDTGAPPVPPETEATPEKPEE